ncbi:HDIG domain-containing metalloprotein [Dyella solisilvae]|nr:HDIG domain-containing metalloprotein [Dyella solisilvae]
MNRMCHEAFEIAADAHRYVREGLLLWDDVSQIDPPSCPALLVTQDGVFPVQCWVDRPSACDGDVVDKVEAVILSMPNGVLHVVSVKRDNALDPIDLGALRICPDADLAEHFHDLLERVETPMLRRFIGDVFSLRQVFQGFWEATAGTRHHAWAGGLARHSVEVAERVASDMSRSDPDSVMFTEAERDLAIAVSLLHDIGKTISYTADGFCTPRALMLGHEVLGVELMHKPLEALRVEQVDLADALTALLLSRTRFAQGRFHLEAIRQVISKADRDSARRGLARL